MIEGLWAQKFVYVDKLVPENYQILNISAVDSHVVWATASAYAPGRPPQDHVLKVLRTINGGES